MTAQAPLSLLKAPTAFRRAPTREHSGVRHGQKVEGFIELGPKYRLCQAFNFSTAPDFTLSPET